MENLENNPKDKENSERIHNLKSILDNINMQQNFPGALANLSYSKIGLEQKEISEELLRIGLFDAVNMVLEKSEINTIFHYPFQMATAYISISNFTDGFNSSVNYDIAIDLLKLSAVGYELTGDYTNAIDIYKLIRMNEKTKALEAKKDLHKKLNDEDKNTWDKLINEFIEKHKNNTFRSKEERDTVFENLKQKVQMEIDEMK